MYNQTELTESILKSPKAKELLGWMPQVYGNAYVLLWLLEVIGTELEEMEGWSKDLEHQVVPQTATWSLPYWEERYQVPVNPEAPLEKRRADVLLRMWQRAPINPYKLEEMLTSMTGLPAKVEENTGKNHFTVRFEGYTGAEGYYLATEELDRLKPAHLIYTIQYLHDFLIQAQVDYDVGMIVTTELIARGKENLGYTKQLLDGSRLLDGSWRLNGYQQAGETTDLYEAACSWNTELQFQKVSIAAKQIHQVFLQQSIRTGSRMNLSGSVPQSVQAVTPSVTVQAAATCKTGYMAEIEVRKNLWRLDGTVRLDGSRMLNAEQYGMEL